MSSQSVRGLIAVWVGVALVAALAIIVQKASAQTATFTIFKKKILLAPGGAVSFTVAGDEPVNCKCTTNVAHLGAHGIGLLALTANTFASPTGPKLSFLATDHDGSRRVGIFCPPGPFPPSGSGFKIGAACPGGSTAFETSPIAVGGVAFKSAEGNHLVQCCSSPGIFIETASATSPAVLRIHSHFPAGLPAKPTRVVCDFVDLK